MAASNYVKMYILAPKPGKEQALLMTLRKLAATITEIDASSSAETYSSEDEQEVVFIERWVDRVKYESGSRQVPKEIFGDLMESLASSPITKTLRAA